MSFIVARHSARAAGGSNAGIVLRIADGDLACRTIFRRALDQGLINCILILRMRHAQPVGGWLLVMIPKPNGGRPLSYPAIRLLAGRCRKEAGRGAITPEPIMKIVMGFMASKNLFVANEIGLFQALSSGPATLQELADKTGVPFRNLRIVAAAMVSVGLLGREGDQYRNSKTSAAFSVGKEGPDLRPLLRFHDQITYPEWQRFEEAVRTDQGQPRFGEFTQEQQQIFSAGVEAFAAAGAAALVMYYDFAPIIAFSMSRAEQDHI